MGCDSRHSCRAALKVSRSGCGTLESISQGVQEPVNQIGRRQLPSEPRFQPGHYFCNVHFCGNGNVLTEEFSVLS